MKTSDFGLAIIEAFEGFPARGKPYRCPAGVLTQGFGHTAAAGGEPLGGQWTRAKARVVLRDDLSRVYEPAVRKALKREPTQGQFDAMVSLCFNIGAGAFARSSVVKYFNRGQHEQAAAAFGLWVKATVGGARKTFDGLVRRRSSEALAYQGIEDLNFNGRRDPDEPVYGPQPQQVERARERVAETRVGKGAAGAAAGGAIVVVQQANEALQSAQPHISAGTWIGLAVGGGILFAAGLALYAKWDDAGRPLPAWLRPASAAEAG
jgi:lysozyme